MTDVLSLVLWTTVGDYETIVVAIVDDPVLQTLSQFLLPVVPIDNKNNIPVVNNNNNISAAVVVNKNNRVRIALQGLASGWLLQ